MTPEFRRKDQRGLTPFTARELFLDYQEDLLEPVARAEFEKLLENEVSLRLDFEKFQDAVLYCRKVSTLGLSPEAHEEVASAPTPIESIAKKLNVHRWPVGLRWGAEALLVISILLVAVLVIPWGKIIRVSDREEIVLAEIERGQVGGQGTELPANLPQAADAQFTDEGAEEKSAAVPVSTPTPATPTPAPSATPVLAKATPTPAPATPTPAPKAQAAAPMPTKPAATPKPERPTIGSLYRGQVEVTNLDATTAKFIEQITVAGGRKAGEVELGWEKGKTRYFHFTIPEARYEEFLGFAGQYGTVQINREPHPRLMPEGIVRVILVLREQGGSP